MEHYIGINGDITYLSELTQHLFGIRDAICK